jgi:hypothetical protein
VTFYVVEKLASRCRKEEPQTAASQGGTIVGEQLS